MARIEGGKFVWECSCGRVSDADLVELAALAVDESVEQRVITCSRRGCENVFELSDEFVETLQEVGDNQ